MLVTDIFYPYLEKIYQVDLKFNKQFVHFQKYEYLVCFKVSTRIMGLTFINALNMHVTL